MRPRLMLILCIISATIAFLSLVLWILSNYCSGNLSFRRVQPEGDNHVVQYRNFEWFDNKFGLYVGRYTLLNPAAFSNEMTESGRGWVVHLYYTGLEDHFDFSKYG
ncbi:MAG TPA: hypothetical protein VH518_16695, partial [Tepidisphaeraceae bacterium]